MCPCVVLLFYVPYMLLLLLLWHVFSLPPYDVSHDIEGI